MNSMDYTDQSAPKHSGLGIASFCLAIFSWLSVFIMFIAGIAGGLAEEDAPDDSPAMMAFGVGMLFVGFLCFLALLLGIISLFQADRKKVFGIIGTVLSLVALVGIVVSMIMGNAESSSAPPAGTLTAPAGN